MQVANAGMPAAAKETGMPPEICAQYLIDELVLQHREVFMPATYYPFRFPGFVLSNQVFFLFAQGSKGIVAFLSASFVPELMESISRATYGEDFVRRCFYDLRFGSEWRGKRLLRWTEHHG